MSLSAEQEAWLASLTVAKLRDELKARDVNSKAKLKAELQAELRSALIEEAKNTGLVSQPQQDPVAVERTTPILVEPEQLAPAAVPDHPPAIAHEGAKEPLATPKNASASVKEDTPTVLELLHEEPVEEPELEVVAEPVLNTPFPAAPTVPPAAHPQHEPSSVPAAAEPAEMASKETVSEKAAVPDLPRATPNATEAGAAEDGAPSGRKKREPIPLYQPRSTDKATGAQPVAKSVGKDKLDEAPSESPGAQAAPAKPAADTPAPAPQQPTTAPPAAKAPTPKAVATPKGKAAAAAAAAPELPPEDPTCALLVGNLVRPFTEPALRKLLGQTGTLVDMWMPSIKTHAYCIFENEDQAAATRKALHGQQWPQGTPKKLMVSFINKQDAELAILKGTNPKAAAEAEAAAAAAKKAEAAAAAAAKQAAAAAAAAAEAPEKGVSDAVQSEEGRSKEASEEPLQRNGSAELVPVKPAAAVPLGAVAAAKRAMAAAATDSARGVKRGRAADEAGAGPDAKRLAGLGMGAAQHPMEVEDLEPVKSLDELFKKTQAKPAIYWLPLTDEEVVAKKKREALEQERQAREEVYRARERDESRGRGFGAGLPPPPLLGPPPRRW